MSSNPQSDSKRLDEPDVITDLSELSFAFEDSGPTEYRAAYSTNADQPTLPDTEEESLPSHEELLLNELALQITGDGKPEFYCRPLGQFLGPMSLHDLRGMAESGALAEDDPVRYGEEGEWKPAKLFPRLAESLHRGSTISSESVSSAPPSTRRLFPTGFKPTDESSNSESAQNAAEVLAKASEATTDPASSPNDSPVAKPSKRDRQRAARSSESAAEEGTKAKRSRKRSSAKAAKRQQEDEAENAVLNEIFDEVFAVSDKTSRPSMPPASAEPSGPPSENENDSAPQP